MDCSLWDFPGNSTGVDCHFLLQGIFPTQGSNPGLPHYALPSEPPGKSKDTGLLSWFHWGSNPGPSARKADVLITTLWNHELLIK